MTYSGPARATTRRSRIRRRRAAGVLVAIVAIVVALGPKSLVSSSLTARSPSTASSSLTARSPSTASAPSTVSAPSSSAPPLDRSRNEWRDALGEAGGAIPDGTTVFDDEVPGVANLDSALLGALRQAATDAAADGVELVVDSGWRSPAYQAQLLREAVSKYGSEQVAAQWVATPNTSADVSGDAVDIGPSGAAWLAEHGAAYGLCQIYGNEPWHFELRPEAVAHGCPAMYADPTHDPRMQQ